MAAAFEMNKCLMAPWNKAHVQAGRQAVVAVGRWGKISSKTPWSAGKLEASRKTKSDTFSPNVILLKGTIIKSKVNTS